MIKHVAFLSLVVLSNISFAQYPDEADFKENLFQGGTDSYHIEENCRGIEGIVISGFDKSDIESGQHEEFNDEPCRGKPQTTQTQDKPRKVKMITVTVLYEDEYGNTYRSTITVPATAIKKNTEGSYSVYDIEEYKQGRPD